MSAEIKPMQKGLFVWRSRIEKWGWPMVPDPVTVGIRLPADALATTPLVVVSNSAWEVGRWQRVLAPSGCGMWVVEGGGWDNTTAVTVGGLIPSDLLHMLNGASTGDERQIYLPYPLWELFRAAILPSTDEVEPSDDPFTLHRLANGLFVQPAPAHPEAWWHFLHRQSLTEEMQLPRLTRMERLRLHGSYALLFTIVGLLPLLVVGSGFWLAVAGLALGGSVVFALVGDGRGIKGAPGGWWRWILYALPVAVAIGVAQGVGAPPLLCGAWGVVAALMTGWLGWLGRRRLRQMDVE